MILDTAYIGIINSLREFLIKKGLTQQEAQRIVYEINLIIEKEMGKNEK